MSKQKREGLLREDTNADEQMSDCDEEEEEEDASTYAEQLREEVSDVIAGLDIDQWVVILYEVEWYPGTVVEVLTLLDKKSLFAKIHKSNQIFEDFLQIYLHVFNLPDH